jgi:hypothetical protein
MIEKNLALLGGKPVLALRAHLLTAAVAALRYGFGQCRAPTV